MAGKANLLNVRKQFVHIINTCDSMLRRNGEDVRGLMLAPIDVDNLREIRRLACATLEEHDKKNTRKDLKIDEELNNIMSIQENDLLSPYERTFIRNYPTMEEYQVTIREILSRDHCSQIVMGIMEGFKSEIQRDFVYMTSPSDVVVKIETGWYRNRMNVRN